MKPLSILLLAVFVAASNLFNAKAANDIYSENDLYRKSISCANFDTRSEHRLNKNIRRHQK